MASDVLSLRIDHSLKTEGNDILNQIGLSPSSFITMAYRQLINKRDIPFETKVENKEARHTLPNVNELSREELMAEIQKGLDDIDAGRMRDLDDVLSDLNKQYGYQI